MRLSNLAIRRGITFGMIFIIAIGFGVFGLSALKIDLFPNITFPIIAVICEYPGVGPEDIENSLSRPLEKAIVATKNIKKMTSHSTSGVSILIVEFDWGTDMNQAEIDVRKNIDMVRDYLPTEAGSPVTFAFDPSMQPILFMTLSSDQLGMAELRTLVTDQIEPRLERIVGVASASTSGGMERQIRVLVEPQKLAALGISIQQILQTLRTENLQIPGGIINDEHKEFTVRTYGEYSNVSQIENTVIGNKGGSPIYLKNVARVIDGFKDQTQVVRNNGKNALVMYVQKQSDANTVQTAKAVRAELPKIADKIGQGVKFSIILDSSEFITRSLNNLKSTALQAFILCFIVLFFFLRHFTSSMIAAISIPVSILVTFFVMYEMKLTLNIISMAGLALAIGMLVDNAIVVLENIYRHKEIGEEIRVAADEGTAQVAMAITASTLTTLAIFVPILFVPGLAGELFTDMVVTIVVSLTASLLVALTLIPLLASRLLSKEKAYKSKFMIKLDRGLGNFIDNMENKYVRILDYFLGHKKVFLMGLLLIIVATVLIYPKMGAEFISRTDQSMISVTIERETSASLTSTDQTFREVEQIIKQEVPEAINIQSEMGTGSGFGALFGTAGTNKGSITISLPDVKERNRSSSEITDVLRKRLSKIPGAKISFSEGGSMFGAGGDVDIKIYGHNREIAIALADKVAERIEKINGVVDIKKSYSQPKPEYQVRLDRNRISTLGLSVYQVASTIETDIKGSIATQYREGGRGYDVLLQLDESARQSMNDIENLYVTSISGVQIPLKNVASVIPGEASEKITREDQERMLSVSCTVSGRDLKSVTTDINNEVNKIAFPSDFRWEIGGSAKDQQESFMYLALALLVAIFLVYMVMASQFESLLDPFIIMFTVPLALIGVVWIMVLTGTTMSVTGLIGCVLLVGVVVNNGIVLVDYINQMREKHGMDLWIAILVSGKRRMRPVLMTALTTIFGMLPLALNLGSGAEIWVPLARTVIGGLTFATIFTLILVPLIYLFFEQIALKRAMKKHRIEMKPIGRPENFDITLIK
ncbi:MAG: AcrB/AcrD/AcrF family protein [Candidatus Marinimicrobia bacterium CG08_land_8_20_14_0_20_45_22]|nr:MAG: AcrB/AcrD/AcrF family protein [Candidatus Marinimicrobia bacterium CG08_land_8_20_14_0_20_45_22]